MRVDDFDFHLPDELIAQEPPPERGASRLLVLNRYTGVLEDATFAEIGRFLRERDLLVVNNTRVFPARLLGRRDPSGGQVECLIMQQLVEPEAQERISTCQRWEALVHP